MREKERALAAIASVVCGGLAAAALGGASWAGKAAVGLFVVTLAALAGSAILERVRRDVGPREIPMRIGTPRDELVHDQQILAEIIQLIRPADITWLRDETFSLPWRGARIEPFRELVEGEHRVLLPFDPDFDDAVHTLMDTTRLLLECYDLNTFPEELVRAHEWRYIGWNPNEADELSGAGREALNQRRAELCALALAVTYAYGDLVDVAREASSGQAPI